MSRLLRHILKCLLEVRAWISGRGFVCGALQGRSEYNISINCDMTVSCNCQDDSSGILGSLDESNFEEIFFGPKANSFRASLANGKLPILTCARCSELKSVEAHHGIHRPPKAEAGLLKAGRQWSGSGMATHGNEDGDSSHNRSASSLEQTSEEVRGECPEEINGIDTGEGVHSQINLQMNDFTGTNSAAQSSPEDSGHRFSLFRVFRGDKNHAVKNSAPLGAPLAVAVVEISSSCFAPPSLPHRGLLVENTIACNLACPGCIRPAVVKIRTKPRMSLEDVRKVSALIQRLGLKKLFYFNRGEPFLSPDILKEIQLIRELNPDVYIVTSTNGMFLDSDEKREAALLMDEVVFSIDGCDQKSLQKYQRGGDFNRALNNLRMLVQLRDARGLSTPQIEWKYLLFNWNDRPRQIAHAIRLAAGGREPVDKLLNGSCSGQIISHKKHKNPQKASSTDQPINSSTDSVEPSADVISFWPTNNPFYGISWRYRLGRLNHIGEKSWKGREIRLVPEVR